MATLSDQVANLNALKTQVDAVTAAVTALKNSAGQSTPELDAAMSELQASMAALVAAAG